MLDRSVTLLSSYVEDEDTREMLLGKERVKSLRTKADVAQYLEDYRRTVQVEERIAKRRAEDQKTIDSLSEMQERLNAEYQQKIESLGGKPGWNEHFAFKEYKNQNEYNKMIADGYREIREGERQYADRIKGNWLLKVLPLSEGYERNPTEYYNALAAYEREKGRILNEKQTKLEELESLASSEMNAYEREKQQRELRERKNLLGNAQAKAKTQKVKRDLYSRSFAVESENPYTKTREKTLKPKQPILTGENNNEQ